MRKLQVGLLVVLLGVSPLFGQATQDSQNDFLYALALKYSPDLWFHKDDFHRPTSPTFPFKLGDLAQRSAQCGCAQPRSLTDNCFACLYDSLSIDERDGITSVYFHARRISDGEIETIRTLWNQVAGSHPDPFDQLEFREKLYLIEYWFYYAHNHYELKVSLLFGKKVPQKHRHDLEHAFFVVYEPGSTVEALQNSQRDVLVLAASAHEKATPNNVFFNVSRKAFAENPVILVEKGSHASCPDVDGNGSADPYIDFNHPWWEGIEWGIRDEGDVFTRYKSRFGMQRQKSDLLRNAASTSGPRYQLYSMVSLQKEIGRLTGTAIKAVLGSRQRSFLPWEHSDFKSPEDIFDKVDWIRDGFESFEFGIRRDGLLGSALGEGSMRVRLKQVLNQPKFPNIILEPRQGAGPFGTFYDIYYLKEIDPFVGFYGGLASGISESGTRPFTFTSSTGQTKTVTLPVYEYDPVGFTGGADLKYAFLGVRIGTKFLLKDKHPRLEFRLMVNLPRLMSYVRLR